MNKNFWSVFTVIVIVGLGLWFLGRPAYQRHKERRFTLQAQEFMQKAQYDKAMLSARQILQLNTNNLAACRIMAELAELGRSPYALVWRRRVAELDPTLDNRLILASSALRSEPPPFPTAARILEELAGTAKQWPAFHVVSAERALRLNQSAQAEFHFQEAGRLEPTNQLHRLNLSVLRLQASTNAAITAAARAQLEALSGDPAYGLVALRSLAAEGITRKDWAVAEQFSRRVLSHTNAVFGDHLQHLSILQEAGSAAFTATLSSLRQTAATNLTHVAELGTWMNSHRLASEVAPWLKSLPAEMQAQQPLPLLLADSYVTQREWRTLEDWLRNQKWGDQEFMRFAILARATRGQNELEVARGNWNKATRAAAERAELLSALAGVAQGWGWESEWEEVTWQLANRFPEERWTLQALEKYYFGRGNTRGLLNIYATLRQRDARDFLAKNNLAAVSLLLHTNLAMAHELAREVYAQNPTNFAPASTYAFSLHLQKKAGEGLAVLGKLPEDQRRHPSLALYHALLLTAVGEREKARKFFALTERVNLLPEEKQLLAEMMKAR